jgi:thiol-disulfide isomerase/thioredoxin
VGIDYTAAPQTLLLLMNTDCRYCKESLPFFEKLAMSNNKTQVAKQTKIAAIFPNFLTQVREYVEQNELDFQTISSPDFPLVKMLGTPTLILTNSRGEILDFWIGKLSDESEQEVLKAVGF